MTYDEAMAVFGTQENLGRAVGVKQSAVSSWNKQIPPLYQFKLEVITSGALRADQELRVPYVAQQHA